MSDLTTSVHELNQRARAKLRGASDEMVLDCAAELYRNWEAAPMGQRTLQKDAYLMALDEVSKRHLNDQLAARLIRGKHYAR